MSNMSMVKLEIDGRLVVTGKDKTILEAARDNGIRIPTLCMLKGLEPRASCRLCVVQVEGMSAFAPACATRVVPGMVVHTTNEKIRKDRKTTLELILSRHAVDCHHCLRNGHSYAADLDPVFCEMCFFCDCVRDGFCELQALAREYEVDELPYQLEPARYETDCSTGVVFRNPNKCVNCRRCVDVCKQVQSVGALGVQNRGAKTIVAPVCENLQESDCVQCGRCIDVCPTGAIFAQEKIDEVIYYAHQYGTVTVAQVSADILGRLGELTKLKPAELDLRKVAAGLKKIGFDYVMCEDYALAAALQVAGKQLEENLSAENPVMMTASHSAEQFVNLEFPELAGQVISYPSAQQQFGELVSGEWAQAQGLEPSAICKISVTQTHTNAAEALHNGSVNYVIDANELYRMFLRTGVNLRKIPVKEFDCFGEVPAVDVELRQLLTLGVPEMTQVPQELTISMSGGLKVIKCQNLGQTRRMLELVKHKKADAAVITLFA